MKKLLLTLALFLIATPAYANTTGYAWSESFGWFDFSLAVVSDTALTGHAYNDNTGWIVLQGVTNTNGTLSGYAWSESVGYFDFSDVIITSGAFGGYAYNDNTGWLSFETGTTVTTTWAPPVDAPAPEPRRSSSGGSKKKVTLINPTTSPTVNTPTTPPSTTNAPYNLYSISNNPRDLEEYIEGEDVRLLQQFLNSRGFIINSTSGLPGSVGYESTYFGNLTRAALARFQTTHNILPSVGYFGPKTRAFIKTLSIIN